VALAPGTSLQIRAASGAGKSTLVAFLAGLRGDYDGEILVDGRALTTFDVEAWAQWRRQAVSIVFQDLRLFPELSARAQVALVREVSGGAASELEARAAALGITAHLDRPVRQLSLGQMQRVAILRALARPYRWLLLDEPFSHLDRTNAAAAWELIHADATAKGAGLLVTGLDPQDFLRTTQTLTL